MSTSPADRVGSDAVPGNPYSPTPPPRPAAPAERTLSSLVAVLRTAVSGKRHERGQEVDGEVLPFDDRVAPTDALRKVAAA
jgi:hypothetical protein